MLRPYTPNAQLPYNDKEDNEQVISRGGLQDVTQKGHVDIIGNQDFNSAFGCSEQLEQEGCSWSGSWLNVAADGRDPKEFGVFDHSFLGGNYDHPATATQHEAAVADTKHILNAAPLNFL